ncbi:hypothetical protein HGB47_16505 [Leptospira yasudae]|nr:hypothetical protein [Leptospira yasudae]
MIEFLISISILYFDSIEKNNLVKDIFNNSVAVALLTFLFTFGSFGIGSILSLFYRVFDFMKINYAELLNHFNNSGFINLEKLVPTLPKIKENLFSDFSWVLVTSIWFERAESCESVKGSIERAQSLSDLMHSAAASMIGSILNLIIIFVIILCKKFDAFLSCGVIFTIIFIGVILVMRVCSYFDARKTLKAFTEIILWNALSEEAIGKSRKKK